jgi:peptide-methionine (S)-S-oxide reductase
MIRKNILTVFLLSVLINYSFGQQPKAKTMEEAKANLEKATFGNGCFWCTEAVFLEIKGVEKVESGYSGGKVKNPTYKEVCTGLTGHAEVIQITFNPKIVSFETLLEIFWNTHDPTTLNKQGADEGTQYRSAVFYHNEEQKKIAEAYKKQLEASKVYSNPIVTEISPLINYYKAEDYHQNYYELNPNQGYCQYVIRPKVEKFKKLYAAKLKK